MSANTLCSVCGQPLDWIDKTFKQLYEALRGVVRVADRKTDEFDAAREALAAAEGNPIIEADDVASLKYALASSRRVVLALVNKELDQEREMKFFADNADYYDALRKIASYQTVEQLRRSPRGEYGLGFHEALEYAYENIREEAKSAIKGKRRPNA